MYGISSNVSEIEDKINLSNFDMIIGATGCNIFKGFDFKKLKKATIIYSVSSSDREFDAVSLRKQIPPTPNCREDMLIDGIYLIYNGFPLNFASSETSEMCVSAEKMQITMSLLLAGCCESMQQKSTGFIDLNMDLQEKIIEKYQEILNTKE